MRQANNWTIAAPIHWRIYVALGGDELMKTSAIWMSFVNCSVGSHWKFNIGFGN